MQKLAVAFLSIFAAFLGKIKELKKENECLCQTCSFLSMKGGGGGVGWEGLQGL